MRRHVRRAFVTTAVVGAVLAVRVELRAAGTIDVSGANMTPGVAIVAGTVTTDPTATLGAVPPATNVAVDIGFTDDYLTQYQSQVFNIAEQGYRFTGLGGPDLHAQTNLTLSVGEHNFGAFVVDQGVTVTIPAGTTVHVAGDARIDGRVVLGGGDAPSWANLDLGGDLTVVGHAGSTMGGIVVENASPTSVNGAINVPGRLTVSADSGQRVRLDGEISVYGSTPATIEHVTSQYVNFLLGADTAISDFVGAGMTVSSAQDVVLTISGATLGGVNLNLGGPTTLTDATIPRLTATAPGGSVHMTGTCAVGGASSGLAIDASGDVVIEDSCQITPGAFSVLSYHGAVVLGTGVQVDLRGMAGEGLSSYVQVDSYAGVEVRGSLKCDQGIDLATASGDIALGSGADLETAGPMSLHAQGAVTATGGTARISADGGLDVRCGDGDLDLDVATVACGGQFVALSNGEVRLRGAFASGRDVQVLSRMDAIDVSGATMRTTDAGASLSGFVRLATYASTASIDASNATLSTGSSDSQSGDILLQIAATGDEQKRGVLRVASVKTRRIGDRIVTLVRGTVTSASPGVELAGSTRVAAGDAAQRLFLRGKHGRFSDAAGAVGLKVARVTKKATSFVLTLRDGGGVRGETVPLVIERAGFRASGKFRRRG